MAKLTIVTPALLREALRAWRYGHDFPESLLELEVLSPHTLSAVQREQELRQLVQGIVEEALNRYRRQVYGGEVVVAPQVRGMAALVRDFQAGDQTLEAWSALYYRYLEEHSLPVKDLAAIVHVSPRHFRRRVTAGIRYLTEALQRLEDEARCRARRQRLQYHLPLPEYTQLVGLTTQALLEQAVQLLTDPTGPRFLSLEGIGGIGKTALARAIAGRFVQRGEVDEVIWVSARQEMPDATTPRLLHPLTPARSLDDLVARLAHQLGQEHLAGLPTQEKLARLQTVLTRLSALIVVDNLETPEELDAFLPSLFPLAGRTRFLLTSRYSLRHFSYVHILPVPELSLEHSQTLLEQELRRQGRLNGFGRREAVAIYQAVGGIPLALKLVAAQLGVLPLDSVLAGLRQARGTSVVQMYRHIYRRTWMLLADPARELLLSMLLISPDGEDTDWLRQSSALPETQFTSALAQLKAYSLLEVTGTVQRPVYRLHRLTITFLHTDVLKDWVAEENKGNGREARNHAG